MLIATHFAHSWRTAALAFVYALPRPARWAYWVTPFSPIVLGALGGGVWVVAGGALTVLLLWGTWLGLRSVVEASGRCVGLLPESALTFEQNGELQRFVDWRYGGRVHRPER